MNKDKLHHKILYVFVFKIGHKRSDTRHSLYFGPMYGQLLVSVPSDAIGWVGTFVFDSDQALRIGVTPSHGLVNLVTLPFHWLLSSGAAMIVWDPLRPHLLFT